MECFFKSSLIHKRAKSLRVSLFVHVHSILLITRHDSSVMVFPARNLSNLLLFWDFVNLPFFHNFVNLFGFFFTAKSWKPGTCGMYRLLIRCSACFLTSSVMPCRIRTQVQNVSPVICFSFAHLAEDTIFDLWDHVDLVAVACSMNFWILMWYRSVIDSFCTFLGVTLDQSSNHRRCVWRVQDLFRQAGSGKCFCFSSVHWINKFLQIGLMCASQFARSRLNWRREFPFETSSLAKVTTFSGALAGMLSYKITTSLLR